MTAPARHQKLFAEALGSAFLLAMVVGSGIMAERLADGNMAIALLVNALATGAGLMALLLTFGPVSAHFNPAVTLLYALSGDMPWRDAAAFVTAQIAGAFIGVWVAHAMFAAEIFQVSTRVRTGGAQMFSEFVATFGLLLIITSLARHRQSALPYAVGAYITAAYWFTASTAFANPAVTLARTATESFAGIRSIDAPLFIAAQVAAILVALPATRMLFGRAPTPASDG